MKVVTDMKPVRKVFRVVDIDDKKEPYGLLDPTGLQIRIAANPKRLVDYALNSGLADDVRCDYDLIKAAAR